MFIVGVAYDIRNDLYFWIIEGGQGPLYRYNTADQEFSTLRRGLDRPVSLAADWVARRLFWVQDGINVSFMYIYMYICMYIVVAACMHTHTCTWTLYMQKAVKKSFCFCQTEQNGCICLFHLPPHAQCAIDLPLLFHTAKASVLKVAGCLCTLI